MTYRTKWTLALTITGVAFALVTYLSTGSLWWAAGAMLVTGMFANAFIAPMTRGGR